MKSHGGRFVLGMVVVLAVACGPAGEGLDGGTNTNTGTDGGSGAYVPNPNATLSDIQAKIFTPSCAASSCHSSQGVSQANTGVDLSSKSASYAGLVNQAINDFATTNVTGDLVVPGHPEQSFLVLKLSYSSMNIPSDDGSAMPLVGNQLTAEQVQEVVDWITQGAQNN